MLIRVDGVTIDVASTFACRGISVTIRSGEVLGVIGPNGSGKSTLLRSVYRVLRPSQGTIDSDDRDIWGMDPRQLAREMAVVVQEPEAEFDFTAAEVVMMGRSPHKGTFARETDEDRRLVAASLHRVGMDGVGERMFSTLSGGEKQRVLIARALAQQARALVLDEPTNHLDLRYQIEILELIRSLRVTAVVAVHDINLAASYCDTILVMAAGEAVAGGPASDVLEPALLTRVFGVGVRSFRPEPGREVFYFASMS
jgi:iron complex transport system ATP-binding protein